MDQDEEKKVFVEKLDDKMKKVLGLHKTIENFTDAQDCIKGNKLGDAIDLYEDAMRQNQSTSTKIDTIRLKIKNKQFIDAFDDLTTLLVKIDKLELSNEAKAEI